MQAEGEEAQGQGAVVAGRDVTVRIGTLDQYLTPDGREAILVRLAELAMGRIKRRTRQGKAVDGQTFTPYSKRYAKQLAMSGRQVSPPKLTLSGAMLASMKVLRSDSKQAVLGFDGTSAAVKFVRQARARKHRLTGGKITHAAQETTRRVANALKAKWNHDGTEHVPPRPFFALSKEDRRVLTADALRQVVAAVRDVSMQRMSSAGALRAARLAGRTGGK